MSTREQLIKARMGMLSLSDELKNIAKALCLLKFHPPGSGVPKRRAGRPS